MYMCACSIDFDSDLFSTMKTIIVLLIITSVAWGQVWTQKCDVQKASVDVNISYY